MSFFSFSGTLSAPHPLTKTPHYAIGGRNACQNDGRSNSPRSAMLKTSACSELPLRLAGFASFGGSSTRESTLERVFSVSVIVVVV